MANKVPKIRFKGFTDDWEQRKLGDVFDERSERASGNEELLSVTISNGVIRQIDSEKRNIASEDKSNYKVVKKGDVPYNSMRMWQGAVGTSDYDGIVSPAYTVLIPKNNCNGKFFMELFKKQPTLEIFKRWSQGLTSDTWNLKYPVLSTIPFMIPSVKEQEKIGDYFSSLDSLITLHQRRCEQTKELKKFMLQKMFPKNGEDKPEIRFDGYTDAWEQRELGEISERVTRKNKDLESTLPLTISAQDGLVDQNEFFNKTVASRDVSGYYLMKNGEFAYNKSYSNGYPWGAVKRLDRYEMGVLSTLYIIFKPTKVNSTFLAKYYDTDNWYKEVSKHAAEGARNHGLLNIAASDFFKTELLIPSSIEEQQKIGTFFKELDHLITLHQRKCEQLKELKKFMLQNMFPKKG
ncbi:restriction endonuclease subunit S [Streptococcus gallolyticus]|uniref:restriction endonuclease subunit S n=1 Tax=Streptococcus gallolyticus TaxID=315405 RepID=UPI0009E1B090|nr:restriction endonuclease subunit S [Streptococcus gallolyticus]